MGETTATPIITICSSANFYRKVVEAQEELEDLGMRVLVPSIATEMKKTGDYDVAHYKTWFADPNDYGKKAQLVLEHFDEVAKADAILVVNEEKHGVSNYIGPNVLMEMAIAFYQRKPIFVLNELPDPSPFEEELKGMQPIILHGDATKLPALYARA